MNYASHYRRLIERARSRALNGYRERHHVIPKCMGGDNSTQNIVELTAEEHYVAHQLLCKIYPAARGLATAAVRMSKQCTGNKAYGWLRRRHAAERAVTSVGNKSRTGMKNSPEHKEKSAAWQRGKKHSPQWNLRISVALRGRKRPPLSVEWRAKLADAGRGKKHSIETKQKMSLSRSSYWKRKHSLFQEI